MEEKNLTEKESLELISQMIKETKHRLYVEDGNALILSGVWIVFVAALTTAAVLITSNPNAQVLWVLVALVVPFVRAIRRKKNEVNGKVSYVDKMVRQLWLINSYSVIAATMIAIVTSWVVLLLYSFVIVGFCAAAQGVVVREKSLVVGGFISVVLGGIVAGMALCGLPLYLEYVLPMMIVSYVAMMIVPGYIIRKKALKQL